MTLKKVVMGLLSVFALLAAVEGIQAVITAAPLDSVGHFRADCSGLFATPDTSSQNATCKGTLIGSGAPLTFTLNNILIGPLNLLGSNGTDNCAFKAGTAMIGGTSSNTITMHLGGSGCATNATAGTGRFAEAYWIESGTGKFISAKGSGSFSVGFDQPTGGQLLIHIDGNITG